MHPTVLEVDLKALAHNYKVISQACPKHTKILAVVKAFGYGSDAVGIAKKLDALGAAYLAVAYTQEGVALRLAGIKTPILVLHPTAANFSLLIKHCLEPTLYSLKMADAFRAFAENEKQNNYPVHIKLNTGLNRLGFTDTDFNFLTTTLFKSPALKVISLFSHLSASEDAQEDPFTQTQLNTFNAWAKLLIKALGYTPLLHCSNTSAVLRHPSTHFSMVRVGIGLYGYGNQSPHAQNLKVVATLKTIISQTHTLQAGDSLGYNRAFIASTQMRTATLPIGHADGLPRALGNGKGWVRIHGEKAPILGHVCMDMIMVDITTIDCEEGDPVEIFGKHNALEDLAKVIDTIPYELLTAISQRIPRKINS